jgi:hypothetical protein
MTSLKAGDTLWSATPVCGRDQQICHFGSVSLPVWVEIWVENRRCPESVKDGVARSGFRLFEQIFVSLIDGSVRNAPKPASLWQRQDDRHNLITIRPLGAPVTGVLRLLLREDAAAESRRGRVVVAKCAVSALGASPEPARVDTRPSRAGLDDPGLIKQRRVSSLPAYLNSVIRVNSIMGVRCRRWLLERVVLLLAVAVLVTTSCSAVHHQLAAAVPARESVAVSAQHGGSLGLVGGVRVTVPSGSVAGLGKLTGEVVRAPARLLRTAWLSQGGCTACRSPGLNSPAPCS